MQHQYTPLRPHQEQQPSKPRFSGSQQPSFPPQRQVPAAGYWPDSGFCPLEARQKGDKDVAKIGHESFATQLQVTNVINNFYVVGGAVTGPNFPALGIEGAGAGAGPKAPASGMKVTGARAVPKAPARGNKGPRAGAR